MSNYVSTKVVELGSCAFRQFSATHSHCQYLHGYQLKAKFWFGCDKLDEKNWAVDFGGLKPLKDILQKQFDHTLCVAADDPCLPFFQRLHDLGACDLRVMEKGVGIERTAEWCYETASSFIKEVYGDRCWVEKVEVFEHENNSAIYSKPKEASISYTAANPEVVSQPQTAELPATTPEPENIPPAAAPEPSRAAQVGRGQVTSGWSNPFGGTSWGV